MAEQKYILLDAAIAAIEAIPAGNWKTTRYTKAIEAIPAADVRPVVRGRWTLNDDGSATCSVCHCTQLYAWDPDSWDNFCHHGGADMREETGGAVLKEADNG